MIIFGTRGVTSSTGSGTFFCPRCRAETPYSQKRVRRFFTLYFIPLIPMDQLGEYVECGRCRGTYALEVLDYDPGAAEDLKIEFRRAVLRVMVTVMLADGRIHEQEEQAVRRIHGKLTGSELSDQQLQREIQDARQRQGSVADLLSPVADVLNDNGKEMLFRAAYLVAQADDDIPPEESKLVAEVGASLGMTGAHIKGLIRNMQEDE